MTAARWNAFGFLTSFLIALLLVTLSASEDIITLFIVMGHGHFFLAYLYQWRAGKIGPTYAALYITALVALLLGLVYVPFPYLWTFVLAGSIFSVHFVIDELFISGLVTTRERVLLCLAFVIAYSILLLRSAYGVTMPGVALVIFALVMPRVIQALRQRSIAAPEMFCISGIVILVLLWFVPKAITLAAVLGFMILLHYSRWYLYYFFKLRERGDVVKLRRYITDVVTVNAGVVFSVMLFWNVPAMHFLGYLFAPTYFYIWTVMHVLSSVRVPSLGDVRMLFRGS